MYSEYISNQPIALETLEKCKKKYPKLEAFLQETLQHPQAHGLNLFSFLIKPVQVSLSLIPSFPRSLIHSYDDDDYR